MSVNKEEKNNKNEHRWKQVTLILDVFFFFLNISIKTLFYMVYNYYYYFVMLFEIGDYSCVLN